MNVASESNFAGPPGTASPSPAPAGGPLPPHQADGRPGAPNTANVHLPTGLLALTLPLASLPGRNGLAVDVAIRYSSAVRSAAYWNLEAPTGPFGLGWGFAAEEKIVRDTKGTGTTLDDRYYLLSEGNLYPLVYTGDDPDGREIYLSENYVFWQIRYQPFYELWTVIKEDGTRWIYGGNAKTPGFNGTAVEVCARWSNWMGASTGGGQEPLATVWNLARQQSLWGDEVNYLYEQQLEYAGGQGEAHCQYTVACRIKEITGATGEKVVFSYAKKQKQEYARWNGDSIAYQDRVDDSFLDHVDVLSAESVMTGRVRLGYALLGSDALTKRVLKHVTRLNENNHQYAPAEVFTYYGESSADGVGISTAGGDKVPFNAQTGALWGALASYLTPDGATYSYSYAAQVVEGCTRDLHITRPQHDSSSWHAPKTYFGPDYSVVLWSGNGTVSVTAYQWQGRWLTADLGVINAPTAEVHVAADFFVVLTPAASPAVHLYAKNTAVPGTWIACAPSVGAGTSLTGAAGDRFFALLDKGAGRLHRFTLDGTEWRAVEDVLHAGEGAVHAMAARGAVLFTATAIADNSFKPELRLYHLDREQSWMDSHLEVEPYCDKAWKRTVPVRIESGIQALTIQLTDSFALVQSRHNFTASAGTYASIDGYRHFVYRWDEQYRIVDAHELDSELTMPQNSDGLRAAAVGNYVSIDAVHLPDKTLKSVHRFVGTGWVKQSFQHDNLRNNYISAESFTVTSSGSAVFHEFDPVKQQWLAKLDPFSDGNPTLFERVWPVIYLIEGLLTLPLGPETLLIDLLFLEIDLVISNIVHNGGAGEGGATRFFTADAIVWHRDTSGAWTKLGTLAETYTGHDLKILPSGVIVKEDVTINQASTQHAAEFVVFTVTQRQYAIVVAGGHATELNEPGYPKDVSRVRLLRNGAFRGVARDLPPGQLLKQSGDPNETTLVGANAFIAYSGGPTLKDATSLTLHRVVDDEFAGVQSVFVVASEKVSDGQHDTSRRFTYADGEMHPSGGTAFFNEVTEVFSGALPQPGASSNGSVKNFFYTGLTGAAKNAPTTGNADKHPALVRGMSYLTRVFDADNRDVASTAQAWQVLESPLTGKRNGYWVRPQQTINVVDGQVRQTDYVFQTNARGFVTESTITNRTLAGDERVVHYYKYACDLYPELAALNLVNAVAQTTVTVNDRVTDTVATIWKKWAEGKPVEPGAARLPLRPRWAPDSTWHALSAYAGNSDGREPDPSLWQRLSRVVALDSTTGVVTETADVDGIATSTVYDSRFRFPVATFTHASVGRGEAGYHGFESYESAAAWQLAGGSVQSEGHMGERAYAGAASVVTAATFAPRTETPYVVSAWVRLRAGGAGAAIGFGDAVRVVNGQPGQWQYIEYVDVTPAATRKPFVRCDGAIDDVRFGPVDAPFSAAAYDPVRLSVTARLGTNGEVIRVVRDERLRVAAEIGPAEQVHGWRGWTFARESTKMGYVPNRTLSVNAASGGRHISRLELDPDGRPLTLLDAQLRAPGEEELPFDCAPFGWGVRFELAFRSNLGRDPVSPTVRLRVGNAVLQIDGAFNTFYLSEPDKTRVRGTGPGTADLMVLAIRSTLLVFQDNALVLSQTLASTAGPITLSVNSTGGYVLRNVCLMRDPAVAMSHHDGLGREMQHISLDDDASGVAITGTLFDGWGRSAVHTMPVRLATINFDYRSDLVSAYDWKQGTIDGLVRQFYDGDGKLTTQHADDARYAASRSFADASPLARVAETAPPGSAYRPGSRALPRWAYGANVGEAQSLAAALNLTPAGAFGFTTTYLPAADGGPPVPEVHAVDRQGNTVARRRGSGAQAATVSYQIERAADGTLQQTTLHPNKYSGDNLEFQMFRPEYFRTVATRDYLGRVVSIQSPDAGPQQMVYDAAGRLRFLLDGAGAALNPTRIVYWKYDALGRRIEEGWISWPWNRDELQRCANSQPSWPSEGGQWTTRWVSDIVYADPSRTNLKGRLARVVTQRIPGSQVIESYDYDTYGRTAAVTLTVDGDSAHAPAVRTTAYRYNGLGALSRILYPAADGSPTGLVVHYTYDTLGRLVAVGSETTPDRYAAYEYAFDGALRTQWLSARAIRADFTYDFQGRRVSTVYREGTSVLFFESLAFGDETGEPRDGSPTRLTVGGRLSGVPYCYRFAYDALGRLVSAQTIPDAGAVISANPAFDVAPISYDANGNLTGMATGQIQYKYEYDRAGTDVLARRSATTGAVEAYAWDASGRLSSSPGVTQLFYDPATSLVTGIVANDKTIELRYTGTRRRAFKVSQTQRKLYVYGAGAEVLVEDEQGKRTSYVYGADGLVAVSVNDQPYAVLRDSLGSTRLVLAFDGIKRAHFNYLPYGGLMPENASSPAESPIPYLFCGRELDAETGLYDFRARLYDPHAGRFTAPDALSEFATPYSYVGGNPIGRVDPYGMWSLPLSYTGYRLGVTGGYMLAKGIIGVALGSAIGALAGGLSDHEDWQRGALSGAAMGAWIGAVAGASLGLLRGVAEFAVPSIVRELRAGRTYPVIAYNADQTVTVGLGRLQLTVDSGRVGAEMIADRQGIPRRLFNDHLVSFQELAQGTRTAPAGFNNRVIAVAHGSATAPTIEAGHLYDIDAGEFARLFQRHHPPRGMAGRMVGRDFGAIHQLDLCVCYPAQSGFARDLSNSLRGRGGPVWGNFQGGWAATRGTTPVGVGRLGGVVREGGSSGSEVAHWLFPFYEPGTRMPRVRPQGAGAVGSGGWIGI